MEERVQKILTRVRSKLGEYGITNIQDQDIYDNGSVIVDDMLQDMKCKEIILKLYTEANKASYSIKNKNTLLIKEFVISWDGPELTYLADWKEAKNITGNVPIYYHIFGGELKLAPAPITSNDLIEIWAYQTSEKNPMSDEDPPETPKALDNILVLGICSEFKPDVFKALYEIEKEKKTSLMHNKTTKNYENNSHW